MVLSMNSWNRDEQATRQSLLEKLQVAGGKDGWEEFYETYSPMIVNFAMREGLSASEAEDVLQETIISVYKQMPEFTYNRQQGSFKSWLYQLVRWRIADQFRDRAPDSPARPGNSHAPSSDRTATIERIPDPNGNELDAIWQDQWQRTALDKGLERLKKKVKTKHYQIFDLVIVQGRPMREVAESCGTTVANVYLIRHRLRGLLKKEVERVESGLLLNPR
ncbi:MAG: rna polymerase sigma factor region 2 [Verrucomicrobiales bacterium]|nr:rna polymerase sigma factor region 2 [Verrucomicrobiales bacterium]